MAEISLDGVTLHVADVERSLAFYERIPGAKLVNHRPGEFALFQIGQGRLGLLQLGTGFHVELSTDNVDEVYAQLHARGIQSDGAPADRPWGERTFTLRDPDGNTIEFDSNG